MDKPKTLRQRIAKVSKALTKKKMPSVAAKESSSSKPVKKERTATKRGVLGDITNKDAGASRSLRGQKKARTDGSGVVGKPEESVREPVDAGSNAGDQRLLVEQPLQEVKADGLAADSPRCMQQDGKGKDEAIEDKVTHEAAPTVHVSRACIEKARVKTGVETEGTEAVGVDTGLERASAAETAGGEALSPAAATAILEQSWIDVDKEHSRDMAHAVEYVTDIFKYYKERELCFMVERYMPRQTQLTSVMRSILVDWLVEVQENFELNHETLYTAVKLVDRYLARSTEPVDREMLQLVGAAAMFIGCKFDERIPPLVDDFLYICDDAYCRRQFVEMEKDILRAVDFDVGIPISYTFLRRYAKCARVSMDTLTLARFILETSLMHYDLTVHRDSLLAAAALWLAIRMKHLPVAWDGTMVHYTGYDLAKVVPIACILNQMMRDDLTQSAATEQTSLLRTIRLKYSHEVFFRSACIPLISDSELSPTCGMACSTPKTAGHSAAM